MRTITVFTLLFVMFSSFIANAQKATATAVKSNEIKNRVIIMTDEKAPFTVFLNDKKVTPKPGTKHVLENLDRQSFNLTIKFFNGATPIKKKLMVKEGVEATYQLKKTNSKQLVFQLVNEKSLYKKEKEKEAGNLMGDPKSVKNGDVETDATKVKNRVIIMTSEDEPFTVFLNDKKMTPKPGTRHVFEDLDRQSYNLRIHFFKGAQGIKKKLMVKEGVEATYQLKKTNAKQFVFQLVNEKPLYKKEKEKETGNLMGDPKSVKNGGGSLNETKIKNRVIIMTKENEPFTVFLNDKKMTSKPGTRHVFEDLDRQSFNLRIHFFKGAQGIKKKLMVKDGLEATYELKKTNAKQFVFQLVNEKPLYEEEKENKPTVTTHNNRVIIYNDTNEPFSVFLNGKKVTPKPGHRQVLENLDRQSFNLKIDFFRKINSINKKLMVKEGKEATYKLKKMKDGQYVFQLEKERTLPGNNGDKHNLMGPQGSKKKSQLHQDNSDASVNIKIDAKVNTGGADVHINGSASASTSHQNNHPHNSAVAKKPHSKPNKGTVYTTKPIKDSNHKNPTPIESKPAEKETPAPTKINTNVNVSNKSCGMDLKKYHDAVLSISAKTSDDSKLTIAKQVSDNYCLTASQIKVIMEQFSNEAIRLDFAKYAYVKCDNKNQYYKVNDAFENETSVAELDKHMKKKNF